MPAIVQLPAPVSTNLGLLGGVLAEGARDYAQQKRVDELEARRRAQQLADIEMMKAEDERRYTRGLQDRRTDTENQWKREDYVATRNLEERRADTEDTRMWNETVKLMDEARKLKERAPFEKNLQTLVNDAANQLKDVDAREREASTIVMSQPPAVDPKSRLVRELAQQLAGGSRNQKDIDAMVPQALEQLQLQAAYRHSIQVKAANEVLQMLKSARAQLTDIVQTGIQQKVAPTVSAPTVPTLGNAASATAPAAPATAEDIAGAVDSLFKTRGAGNKAPSTGRITGGPSVIDNPQNIPALYEANVELQARDSAQMTALNNRLAEIDTELQSVSAPKTPTLGMGLGGYSVGQFSDPMAAASNATRLLQERAAIEKQRNVMQNRLVDTTPAVPTPVFSTPNVNFKQPNRLLDMAPNWGPR